MKRTQRINQAVRETVFPQATLASICLIGLDGDAVNVAEANREEPLSVRLPTSAGVIRHGMGRGARLEKKCRELGRPGPGALQCSDAWASVSQTTKRKDD